MCTIQKANARLQFILSTIAFYQHVHCQVEIYAGGPHRMPLELCPILTIVNDCYSNRGRSPNGDRRKGGFQRNSEIVVFLQDIIIND